MKYFKGIMLFLLLICCSFNLKAQIEDEYALNICSFNIRGSNMDVGINAWNSRKKGVLKVFTQYQYDVVCMQEPLIDQINDFLTIGCYEWLGLSSNLKTNNVDIFSPIFYNKNKLNVLDYGTFWLSLTPNIPSKGWDGKFQRICTWAHFRDIKNCRTFYVFNTHLDHVGEIAKLEGAKLICKTVNEKNNGEAVFITGDMNSTPNTGPIVEYTKTFLNSRDIAKNKIGPFFTVHSFSEIPTAQIDFIFVNKEVEVLEAKTDTKKMGVYYLSDHYPISIKAIF